MQFTPGFSLIYGGQAVSSADLPSTRSSSPEYRLGDLCANRETRLFKDFDAVYWRMTYQNTGASDSAVLSDIFDGDLLLPLPANPPAHPVRMPPAGTTALWYETGNGAWGRGEWRICSQLLPDGASAVRRCVNGRSSQEAFPFFDINQGADGYIVAVGWTGQWNARFERTAAGVRLRCGIEDLGFVLRPGESVDASSVLVMEYHDGQETAHNRFRRLMKSHFSLLGQPGRPAEGPYCLFGWGGLPSDQLKERIAVAKREQFGFDTYWVDAGWYGQSQLPCPDTFTGDWSAHTGDWRVNPHIHPKGMTDVAAAARDAGMGFLLWVEPERVIKTTPVPAAHPEWYFQAEGESWLLDLGNEEAWQNTFDTLCGLIDALDIACYRQDFNIDPLPFWRAADEPDRRGIHELRHINGLYRLWDALLAKYPHLYIDNCASGGRRLDIETFSRSLPLWRTDFNCWLDADPDITQCHNSGLSWFVPFHGTADLVPGDTYGARSAYASSMQAAYFGYAFQSLPESLYGWMRRIGQEYFRVRPFTTCDYYAPIPQSTDPAAWCSWQFERPETGEGVLTVFRRAASPYDTATLTLGGLAAKGCVLTDADTGEVLTVEGGVMQLTLPEARSCRLWFYKTKSHTGKDTSC